MVRGAWCVVSVELVSRSAATLFGGSVDWTSSPSSTNREPRTESLPPRTPPRTQLRCPGSAKARLRLKNSSSAQLPLEKPELQKSLGNL